MPKKDKCISRAGKQRPLILVSNDDGVRAAGLEALARSLRGIGRVIVVAPNLQRSAASHSITLHRPLRIEKMSDDVYSVDGTPADCIMLAVHELLDARPDIIVSGINDGANLGDDVHYSGTVSAAIEGGILGIPAMAISLINGAGKHFSSAAKVAAFVATKAIKEGLPSGIILNINVPNVPPNQIKGSKITRQGKRNYGGIIVEKVDPRGRKYYWIGGDESCFEDIPNSDCNAVRDGFVSITPLRVNLTDKASLAKLTHWEVSIPLSSKRRSNR